MKQFIQENFSTMLRMVIVGSIGFFVQILTYNGLRYYFTPVWSVQLSIVFAMITNFYAHGHFTFSQGGTLKSKKGIIYLIYASVMLILQGQWLRLGIYFFGEQTLIENGIIIVGLGWGVVCNYLFYRYYIWSR